MTEGDIVAIIVKHFFQSGVLPFAVAQSLADWCEESGLPVHARDLRRGWRCVELRFTAHGSWELAAWEVEASARNSGRLVGEIEGRP